MKATSFSSSISANLGNSGEAMLEIHKYSDKQVIYGRHTFRSCPSLQRCCWNMTLHPNIIVHVENVVSLFYSPSTSSQKVREAMLEIHKYSDKQVIYGRHTFVLFVS